MFMLICEVLPTDGITIETRVEAPAPLIRSMTGMPETSQLALDALRIGVGDTIATNYSVDVPGLRTGQILRASGDLEQFWVQAHHPRRISNVCRRMLGRPPMAAAFVTSESVALPVPSGLATDLGRHMV